MCAQIGDSLIAIIVGLAHTLHTQTLANTKHWMYTCTCVEFVCAIFPCQYRFRYMARASPYEIRPIMSKYLIPYIECLHKQLHARVTYCARYVSSMHVCRKIAFIFRFCRYITIVSNTHKNRICVAPVVCQRFPHCYFIEFHFCVSTQQKKKNKKQNRRLIRDNIQLNNIKTITHVKKQFIS